MNDDDGNLRHRDGNTRFVPPSHRFDPRGFEVAEIDSDRVVRDFVQRHHYAGTLPAARFRFCLYNRGAIVGAAVFSHPSRDCVLTNWFPDVPRLEAVELGRFVLLDEVGFNGETWFLARAFDLLADRIAGVLSFSDPLARARLDGTVVMPGHKGTIYQAANAKYLGRARADKLWLLPDARVLARRTYQKIRDGEVGWHAATAQLTRYGADPIPETADEPTRRAWLEVWRERLVRVVDHPGNHRYGWALRKRLRKAIHARWAHVDLPYPKAA